MNQFPKYDIVIVGAGPVGLATAIALYHRGLENILVIDQTRQFRPVGQAVDLLPNGLRALKLINSDVYEAVKNAGNLFLDPEDTKHQNIHQWVYKNTNGEVLRSIPLSYDYWLQTYGEGRVSIAWYDLQTTFRKFLPESKVCINHRCVNLVQKEDSDYIRIDCQSNLQESANPYAHWPEYALEDRSSEGSQINSIDAKLVIGADGINSTVRHLLYPESQPYYSGYAAIGCMCITDVPDNLAAKIQKRFLGDLPIISLFNQDHKNAIAKKTPRLMLFCRKGNQLGYFLHHTISLVELQNSNPKAIIDLAVQILQQAQFPEELIQLIALSPPQFLFSHPYYIHPVTPQLSFPPTADSQLITGIKTSIPWSQGKIVLAGDAAHGMPPFAAQGVNQGLEDSWFLSQLICDLFQQKRENDLDRISQYFANYKAIRHPIMVDIQQATLNGFYQDQKEWNDYNQRIYSGFRFSEVQPLP